MCCAFPNQDREKRTIYSIFQQIDIDECEMKTSNCGPDEICKNKPGGYTCSCPAGHTLNAQRRCEDVDECDFYHGQVKFKSTNAIQLSNQFAYNQIILLTIALGVLKKFWMCEHCWLLPMWLQRRFQKTGWKRRQSLYRYQWMQWNARNVWTEVCQLLG